ncbi:DNA mismatch repair endonuclease MutL [Treponema sp.]
MAQNTRYAKVHILSPEVARKIAAGEVVDRPASLVRELLDNAIDSGAQTIELTIEGGGASLTEVSDDGSGMRKEDLELCWQAHATSKILNAEDLLEAETLGFRGEALSAISAVARLSIITSPDGREAWKLTVGGSPATISRARIESTHRSKGTSVRVEGLFDAIPARKKFLKRAGSEALLCRQILIDKALAFPEINFRYTQDGELKIFLNSVATRRERFIQALLSERDAGFVHEISASGEGFSLSIVVGGSELHRGDRRLQFIIANGRRIQDFGLQQALEFGVQGWFPNGTHPLGAIYIDIDPALADFNIHPAKREVRFKDGGAIHHAVTSALRSFMHHFGIRETEKNLKKSENYELDLSARRGINQHPLNDIKDQTESRLALEALLDRPPHFAPLPGRTDQAYADPGFADETQASFAADEAPRDESAGMATEKKNSRELRFLGTAFDLFLVVQREDSLFLIDQHAAHERILYDRYQEKLPARQDLLVPLPFVTDSEEDDAFLQANLEQLGSLGILIQSEGQGNWNIEALPAAWKASDAETVQAILELRRSKEHIGERWLATLACHTAVKDGELLDENTALALAQAALNLPIPRCPHGRPVWKEISKEFLLRSVCRLE